MIWDVAGPNGHVHESISEKQLLRSREEAIDAGFKTLLAQILLAQSKLDALPKPQGPVTIALQGFTNHLRTMHVDLKINIPCHEMWKTEEPFAASQRWPAAGIEGGKMIQPHGRGSIYGPIEYSIGHQDGIARDELGMIFSETLDDGGLAGTIPTTTHMPPLIHFNSRCLEIHTIEGEAPSAKTKQQTMQCNHRHARNANSKLCVT